MNVCMFQFIWLSVNVKFFFSKLLLVKMKGKFSCYIHMTTLIVFDRQLVHFEADEEFLWEWFFWKNISLTMGDILWSWKITATFNEKQASKPLFFCSSTLSVVTKNILFFSIRFLSLSQMWLFLENLSPSFHVFCRIVILGLYHFSSAKYEWK